MYGRRLGVHLCQAIDLLSGSHFQPRAQGLDGSWCLGDEAGRVVRAVRRAGPGERINLAADRPDKVAELQALLQASMVSDLDTVVEAEE